MKEKIIKKILNGERLDEKEGLKLFDLSLIHI